MSTTKGTKPVPVPDEQSQPFFDGAKRHELMILRCGSCGHPMWPASHAGSLPLSPRCHRCFASDLRWDVASGKATLYSFVVMHQPYPGFEDEVPYNIALVELEEGVRCISNVVGCENADLQIGMPLDVVFDDLDDEVALPRFRSAQ
jgi:uncharacterized OB-fold protein